MKKSGILTQSVIFLLIVLFMQCASDSEVRKESEEMAVISEEDRLPPPGDKDDILNERGEVVFNHIHEPKFFREKSKDFREYFRVIVSSEDYQVRQIRGSSKIRRKLDPAGDELLKEEMKQFNIVNMKDEGILDIVINSYTGKVEVVNFEGRVPRINELAKVIQNDAMRWDFEHEMRGEKTQVNHIRIYYQIILKQKMTREEIKERFLMKKKR